MLTTAFSRWSRSSIVTIASDIGGYAVGATLGRHPMAPRISPKKSWEGFAGSVAGCLIAGVLCVLLLLDGAWWVGLRARCGRRSRLRPSGTWSSR